MRPALLPALLAALAFSCGLPEGDYFGKVADHPDPSELRFCNNGEPEYLDPALVSSTTGSPLAYAMFDGLARYNADGRPEPSIATRWDISDDLRTFTFHLRKDARWSNGRPITSADFVYQVQRILHPDTLSRNTEPLTKIKNGALYNARRVKLLLRDSPPFHEGDIVEIIGLDGKTAKDPDQAEIPDSNRRTSKTPLPLRDLGAPEGDAYATVPAGAEVVLIELQHPQGDGARWAYVFYHDANGGDGVYGWIPAAQLSGQPNGEVAYTVRDIPPEHIPGKTLPHDPSFEPRKGRVKGRDLLMLPEVLGVRAPDPYTFVVETWGPLPYLIDIAVDRFFRPSPRPEVSRHPKRWTDPDHIVVSGAFKLTLWKQRDRIEFSKNPSYWDAEHVKLDKLTIFSIDDQAASANYYIQGGCDAVAGNNIPSSYLPVLRGERRRTEPYKDYHGAPYLGIYYYVINTEKIDNVHFRRALNLSVDRRPIPIIVGGGQTPTASFMWGVEPDQLSDEELALCGIDRDYDGLAAIVEEGKYCYLPPRGLDYDLPRAKKELALARKEMGDEFPQHFDLKYNQGVEGHKLIAEYMQREWSQKLGLDVTLATQEWKTFLKDTNAGNFEVARMGWIGDFPDPESNFLLVFRCGSPYNRSRWCNKEYERLYTEAERTADRGERLELMRRAEKVMLEEAPSIPLYVYKQHHLQKPYVRGLDINPNDIPVFRRAWIDPDWRAHRRKEAKR